MRTLRASSLLALFGILPVAAVAAEIPGFQVIVHPSNPITGLTSGEVRSIFAGSTTHWPDHARIVLVHRASGSPPNTFLMDHLLKTSWQDYKRSLEGLEFMGQEPVVVRVLNSDAAACKFVFNVPSAIAVIQASAQGMEECRDVKVLRIDGLLPAQQGYRLR